LETQARQAFAFFLPMTPEQVAFAERMVNVLPANTDGPENTDGNPNVNGDGQSAYRASESFRNRRQSVAR